MSSKPRLLLKPHLVDVGFITLVATYIFICWRICVASGFDDRFSPLMYLGLAGRITFTLLLGYALYRLLRVAFILVSPRMQLKIQPGATSKGRPLKLIMDDLKAGPLRPEIYQRGLPIFIAFIFFFSTFTSMKFLIPDIKPFEWDTYFMKADLALHLGLDPWRILQPVLGYPVITRIISFIYILWLPAFFFVLYWQLFRFKDHELRMRFFYTFILTWAINGTFLAIFFSSAGPCFFEKVTGADYYAQLMDYLRATNETYQIYSVYTQDLLWRNHVDKAQLLGGGISAFPSVHVSTVFLFVLMARNIDRLRLWIFGAFFLVILLGSIHLGWHYAVDGYFSILTTWIIWSLTGCYPRTKRRTN
jgi:PAP2 superfamily